MKRRLLLCMGARTNADSKVHAQAHRSMHLSAKWLHHFQKSRNAMKTFQHFIASPLMAMASHDSASDEGIWPEGCSPSGLCRVACVLIIVIDGILLLGR